jgi:hypothetical protein
MKLLEVVCSLVAAIVQLYLLRDFGYNHELCMQLETLISVKLNQ